MTVYIPIPDQKYRRGMSRSQYITNVSGFYVPRRVSSDWLCVQVSRQRYIMLRKHRFPLPSVILRLK